MKRTRKINRSQYRGGATASKKKIQLRKLFPRVN